MSTVINEKYCSCTSSSICARHSLSNTELFIILRCAVPRRALQFDQQPNMLYFMCELCIVHACVRFANGKNVSSKIELDILTPIKLLISNVSFGGFLRYSMSSSVFSFLTIGTNVGWIVRAWWCTDMPCIADISSIKSNVCETEPRERKLMLYLLNSLSRNFAPRDWNFRIVATQLAVKTNRPGNLVFIKRLLTEKVGSGKFVLWITMRTAFGGNLCIFIEMWYAFCKLTTCSKAQR